MALPRSVIIHVKGDKRSESFEGAACLEYCETNANLVKNL